MLTRGLILVISSTVLTTACVLLIRWIARGGAEAGDKLLMYVFAGRTNSLYAALKTAPALLMLMDIALSAALTMALFDNVKVVCATVYLACLGLFWPSYFAIRVFDWPRWAIPKRFHAHLGPGTAWCRRRLP